MKERRECVQFVMSLSIPASYVKNVSILVNASMNWMDTIIVWKQQKRGGRQDVNPLSAMIV
jgi:hypothetical protein